MVNQDKKQFYTVVIEVIGMYNQEISEIGLQIWWQALHDYDLNKVMNALGEYCANPNTCKFSPKPGDIVGIIDGNHANGAFEILEKRGEI